MTLHQAIEHYYWRFKRADNEDALMIMAGRAKAKCQADMIPISKAYKLRLDEIRTGWAG